MFESMELTMLREGPPPKQGHSRPAGRGQSRPPGRGGSAPSGAASNTSTTAERVIATPPEEKRPGGSPRALNCGRAPPQSPSLLRDRVQVELRHNVQHAAGDDRRAADRITHLNPFRLVLLLTM